METIKRFRLAAVLFGVVVAGCGGSSASSIQSDLDNDPRLKQAGIEARVSEFKDGFVTVTVTKHDFGPKARVAIASGESLRDIYMGTTMAVGPLMQSEEVLKKRPDVKAIIWTFETLATWTPPDDFIEKYGGPLQAACQGREQCVSISFTTKSRCREECISSVKAALANVGVTSVVLDFPYQPVSAEHPRDDTPCVGFRPDAGGTDSGAKALVAVLGAGYRVVGPGTPSLCTASGFAYNLFLQ